MAVKDAVEQGHHHRDGNAVVCTQRRAVGGQLTAVLDQADAIALKVVRHVAVLLAHHIGMSLKKQGSLRFSARGCRPLNEQIVACIAHVFQRALTSKPLQIIRDALLVARTARNGADLLKKFKNDLRLKAVDHIITHISFLSLPRDQRRSRRARARLMLPSGSFL